MERADGRSSGEQGDQTVQKILITREDTPKRILGHAEYACTIVGLGIVHCDRYAGDQYVARPPLKSNTAPVVNEFSAETIHATIAAASSTARNRPRGIFESM